MIAFDYNQIHSKSITSAYTRYSHASYLEPVVRGIKMPKAYSIDAVLRDERQSKTNRRQNR